MKRFPNVLHLIDDTTAGGVTRVVAQLALSAGLSACTNQQVLAVPKGRFGKLPKDADIIVSHTAISWRTLPAMMALRAARPNATMIHVEHTYTEGFVAHKVKKTRRFFSLLATGYSLFDKIVAVSEAQGKWIRRHDLCPPSSQIVIPSWVDLEPFRALPAPTGPIRTFGAVGRLDPQKGFDRLIQAFRALPSPDVRLRIIGTGAQETELRSLAGSDPRIQFAGFVADAKDAYTHVDAIVMPSRWEAFGLVATEALAAGRPVLCADVDGLRDHTAYGATLIQGVSINDLTVALQAMTDGTHRSPHHAHLRRQEMECAKRWTALLSSSGTLKGSKFAESIEVEAPRPLTN